MTVLVAIAIIIGAAIVSWSLVAGIVWIGCLIAGVAFSWRYAMAAAGDENIWTGSAYDLPGR